METLILATLLGVIALIIIGYGTYHNKKIREYDIRKIKGSYGKACERTYGEGEYAHIRGYYNTHRTEGGYTVDDITWNDLNLDSVYRSLNYTGSSAGDEYLYHLLRTPRTKPDPEVSHTEELVRYYMSEPEKRLVVQTALHDMGRTGKYSIYDYINNLDAVDAGMIKGDYLLLAIYAVAVAAFVFNTTAGGLILLAALFYGGLSYFSKKRKIEPYIISFSYVIRLIDGAREIAALKDDKIEREAKELKGLVKEMAAFGRFSSLVMSASSGSGNPIEILIDYIKIFTHIDIIRFFTMRKEIIKHTDDIDRMLTIIGFIDSCIAIGSYRTFLGKYTIPEFLSDGPKFCAVGLYHPLLDDPVANDVSLDRGMLLTGSNASGKSTMLRTMTLAAVLAQSINTVPADEYRAPLYRIYTSLSLSDDILKGESYYMTEIRALKRIIDAGKDENIPILAAVDEVLRGTNTVERISASTAIMKQLSKVNGLILAATHDLELTELLKDCFDNYHFEETIVDDDISFAYKLLPGAATTRNAIKLLRIMGYDEYIVKEAEDMAKDYGKAEKDNV